MNANLSPRPYRRLLRCSDDRIIGGVCSGLALYFSIDVIIIRAIFLAVLLGMGVGLLVYIVLWVATPAATTAEIRSNNG
ncbi:MAG: PspC domain-containing protein [Bacteroidales bacterium]|nr:PspC domain-containing protein [Bacteroidales bacterium]